MSEHKATIRWTRTGPDFLAGKYSREHTWMFDGGVMVPASASPSVGPVRAAATGFEPAIPRVYDVAAENDPRILECLIVPGSSGSVCAFPEDA